MAVSYGNIRTSRRPIGRLTRQNPFESPHKGSACAAEFFAGIGLVRLALEQQGWQVVFANDIDPNKREMYDANFNGNHFRLGDIHKLNPDDIPECELFTASFPCNDLSIAGAWKGLEGKESSAFWGLIDILKALGSRKPPLVMLENVVGFLQSHGGRDFETALLALNELGYCVDAFILNAVHWVPQSRGACLSSPKPTASSPIAVRSPWRRTPAPMRGDFRQHAPKHLLGHPSTSAPPQAALPAHGCR